jgi:hypothetical protein
MISTTTKTKQDAKESLLPAQVDADSAYDAASRASSQACEWSSRAGLSGEDAAEAVAAAERARKEAHAASIAKTSEEAWSAARAAWAAASSAMEALERVSAEIKGELAA